MDIWPLIHAERKALAEDLKGRTGDDWATASLCSPWTVRDVLAHMTSAASATPPVFFGRMAASGFSSTRCRRRAWPGSGAAPPPTRWRTSRPS